ncbi:MAG: MBL fold metallo-hydrolase [Erythrobacter sp.]|nr:MBL fold metallo-hydrolase [Erythrobacter sp.]
MTFAFATIRNAVLTAAAAITLASCATVSAQEAPTVTAAAPTAQWITLGTSGGPAVQVHRSQIANALVVGDAVYLFDVGNGVQRQMAMAGLDENHVRAVFLSHHHLDHNADLGPVLVTHWTFGQGVLPVFGPEGTSHLVLGLADANAPTLLAGFPTGGPAKPPLRDMVSAADLPFALQEPVLVYEDENVRVSAIGVDHYQLPPSVPLDHMPDAVAYRVEAGGRTIVFTGDSGPSPRLARFMQGADLLVTEVVEAEAIAALLTRTAAGAPDAVRQSIIAGMRRNHLEPAEIGRMAAAAGVGAVVLTHFVPSPEDAADREAYVRDIRSVYAGPVTMANDLDRF